MPQKPKNERRRSFRLGWTTRVKVTDPRTNQVVTKDARLVNIGRWGLAIFTDEPLSRGHLYLFEIMLIGKSLHLSGRVIHMLPDSAYFNIVGVKIESVDLLTKSQVNKFLTLHSRQLRVQFLSYSLLTGMAALLLFKFAFGLSWSGAVIAFIVTTIFCYSFLPF